MIVTEAKVLRIENDKRDIIFKSSDGDWILTTWKNPVWWYSHFGHTNLKDLNRQQKLAILAKCASTDLAYSRLG